VIQDSERVRPLPHFAEDQEGKFVVAGGAPQGQREDKGIDLVLLPESKLLILMLRSFVEDVVLGAERNGPAVVGLLSDAGCELSIS
jgi:hypothetical protein